MEVLLRRGVSIPIGGALLVALSPSVSCSLCHLGSSIRFSVFLSLSLSLSLSIARSLAHALSFSLSHALSLSLCVFLCVWDNKRHTSCGPRNTKRRMPRGASGIGSNHNGMHGPRWKQSQRSGCLRSLQPNSQAPGRSRKHRMPLGHSAACP